MTTRRQFMVAGAGLIVAIGAAAQARRVKIGMLGPVPLSRSVYGPGVVRRLAELGYRDGGGSVLEYRSADGVAGRYAAFARELIDLQCDLVIPLGTEISVRALQDARAAMPIVFLAVDYDPQEKGIVTSLSRPDRNTTGVYLPQKALVGKRIEILREVVPQARRYLVVADQFSRDLVSAAHQAARSSGIELTVVEFSTQPYDFESAFETGRKAGAQAFMSLASPPFAAARTRLAGLLEKYRLPSVGTSLPLAEAGYLLSFNVDVGKATGRVADMAARILKGANPSAIPVEQADEFELVINAKTARTLGIKLPESVLARATRIVS